MPEQTHIDWLEWLTSYGTKGPTIKPKTAETASKTPKPVQKAIPKPEAPDGGPPVSVDDYQPPGQTSHDSDGSRSYPITQQAKKEFPGHMHDFVDLWFIAATDALAGAPEAEDEESSAGFWVALAGNLAWAATCLLPGGAEVSILVKTASVTMSFGGAAAGSGLFTRSDDGKAPSGKEAVGQMLAVARDQMMKGSRKVIELAANECGDNYISDPEEQKKVLWRRMFRTPYDEAEPIRAEMNRNIKKALASFLRQWKKWKTDTMKEAVEKDGPIGAIDGGFERVRKAKPFTPELSFD